MSPAGFTRPPCRNSLPLQEPPQPSTAPDAANQLSGRDVLEKPSIFSGLCADSTKLNKVEQPEPLGREEELELVKRALFFIASTNAQRELATRAAIAAVEDAAAEGVAVDDVHVDMSDFLDTFNHEELLHEMRAEAESQMQKRLDAALRTQFKRNAPPTETPVDVPHEMSDTEFRVAVSLGRAAYNKLFNYHQRLVYFEVNKLVNSNWQRATVMEKADFLQEGAQGLLRAIRLFDTTRGVRFSTYASWHVRAFVLRALRDKSHIVRLPQTLQGDMQQIRKARYRYAVETHGRAPKDAELAEMLQWPLTRVAAALQGLASCIATSLDSGLRSQYGDHVLSHDKDQTLGEAVVSTKHSSPHGHRVDESVAAEQDVYETQLKKTLDDAMAERDPRRIQITRLKYGLEDGVEWTYPELARASTSRPTCSRASCAPRSTSALQKEGRAAGLCKPHALSYSDIGEFLASQLGRMRVPVWIGSRFY